MDERVNTYDPAEYARGYNTGAGGPAGPGGPQNPGSKKKFTWKRGMFIFVIILAIIIVAAIAMNYVSHNGSGTDALGDGDTVDFNKPYIGMLHVDGTISESDSSSLLSSSTYHHQWTLNCIDDMIDDKDNKALILFVNSPGGSVYASDELYLKVKEYQKKTGRPVYSYMASEAASGGYYISSPCDKIVANRNCWTGSIGVTIGTLYDVTGLLKKMGVKTVTITSGRNKAMGSSAVKMTKEQRKIFQGLVDESYDQFVSIVASGRNMSVSKVRKLADGRVYTAKQAKSNGLIDEISTFDNCLAEMKVRYGLTGADLQDITYSEDSSFLSSLLGKAIGNKLSGTTLGDLLGATSSDSEYDQIKTLLGANNKFTVTYMSNISK